MAGGGGGGAAGGGPGGGGGRPTSRVPLRGGRGRRFQFSSQVIDARARARRACVRVCVCVAGGEAAPASHTTLSPPFHWMGLLLSHRAQPAPINHTPEHAGPVLARALASVELSNCDVEGRNGSPRARFGLLWDGLRQIRAYTNARIQTRGISDRTRRGGSVAWRFPPWVIFFSWADSRRHRAGRPTVLKPLLFFLFFLRPIAAGAIYKFLVSTALPCISSKEAEMCHN